MNINATLIVQALNFGIAYILLRKFFFRPAVTILLAQQEEEKILHDAIAGATVDLQEKKERMQVQWQERLRELKDYYPKEQKVSLALTIKEPEIVLPTQESLGPVVAQVQTALVQKVVHDVHG